MDNNISAWLEEADDDMLDDFDLDEDDSDGDVLDNPENSYQSIGNLFFLVITICINARLFKL